MNIYLQNHTWATRYARLVLVIAGISLAGLGQAATLVVDEGDDPGVPDNGKCSLREAIAAINNGAEDAGDCLNDSVNGFGVSDEIQFDAALSGAEIDLSGAELPQIVAGLLITGPVALDPAGITIDGENNSRIFNIDSSAPVSFRNLTLKRGRTTADNEDGGALRSVNTPLVSFADVNIMNSSTEGLQSRGGGIFVVDGNVDLLRTTVSGNSTAGNGAPGGGLYITAGDLTVKQSLFAANSTAGFDSDGGGLYIANGNEAKIRNSDIADNFTLGNQSTGGGLSRFNGSVVLDNCEVTGNHTEGDDAGGGGLHVLTGNITLRLDTIVSNNSTEGTDAHGGGIYAEDAKVSLTEPKATVSGNATTGFGARGGGISIHDGSIVTENSTVSNNSTSGQNGHGGGMYVRHSITMPNSSVRNSVISGNSTTGENAEGGGLTFFFHGSVTLTDSTVSGNTTTGASAEGGGFLAFGDVDATLINSTISGNSTQGAASPGGGLSFRDGDFTLINSTVSGNINKESVGGGLFVNTPTSATLIHSTVAFNTALQDDSDGMFIFVSDPSFFRIYNSLIVQSGAGDVACENTDATLVNSLATDASCGVPVATAAEIGLAALTFNGGPTQTHALANDSVAIDVAPDDAYCGDMPPIGAGGRDQRGVPRPLPLAGQCDLGAVEKNQSFDFGDAPSADQSGFASDYPTLLSQNGAAHSSPPFEPRLGVSADSESDGQPSALADGDDNNLQDDENGVFFTSAIEQGSDASVDIIVFGSNNGILNAWMDFNADGDWQDAGEHIFINEPLMAGANAGLVFPVPADALSGNTFARFRFSSAGGLAPSGVAIDGEVEDYMVFIGPEPTVMFNSAEDNPSIDEKAGTFTIPDAVLLSNPSSQEITVDILFDAGASDAELPADFDFAPMTVTFAPGETRADIEVMIAKDDVEEQDEVAVFNLANPVNATLGMPSTFTATLKDSKKSSGGTGGSGCGMGDGKVRLDPVLTLLVLLAAGWLIVGWLTGRHVKRSKPWE